MSTKVATLLREKAGDLRKQASFINTFNDTVIDKVASDLNIEREEAMQLVKAAAEGEMNMNAMTPMGQAGEVISFLLGQVAQNSAGGPVKSFAQSWAGKDYSNSESVRNLLNALKSRGMMKEAEEASTEDKELISKVASEALVEELGLDLESAQLIVNSVLNGGQE